MVVFVFFLWYDLCLFFVFFFCGMICVIFFVV